MTHRFVGSGIVVLALAVTSPAWAAKYIGPRPWHAPDGAAR